MPAGIFFIRKYCLSIDGGGDLAGFSQKIQPSKYRGKTNPVGNAIKNTYAQGYGAGGGNSLPLTMIFCLR